MEDSNSFLGGFWMEFSIKRVIVRYVIIIVSLFNHYENMPMQYTDIFKVVKNEN